MVPSKICDDMPLNVDADDSSITLLDRWGEKNDGAFQPLHPVPLKWMLTNDGTSSY